MAKRRRQSDQPEEAVDLRIIGGEFRGTKLTSEPLVHTTGKATGQRVTRPMKHRVREAIFNLVGAEAKGKHAIDLFAGTGALGLEALSRGAQSATLIERHVPTATVVKQNIAAMSVEQRCELLVASAFVWGKRDLADDWGASHRETPWLAFVSPPYAFFIDREQEMLDLIDALLRYAPHESVLVVEADERFDFELLPGEVENSRKEAGWDVREYQPAVVGVWRVAGRNAPSESGHHE